MSSKNYRSLLDRQEPSTNVTDAAALGSLLSRPKVAHLSRVIFRKKRCCGIFSQSYPTLKGVPLVGTGSQVGRPPSNHNTDTSRCYKSNSHTEPTMVGRGNSNQERGIKVGPMHGASQPALYVTPAIISQDTCIKLWFGLPFGNHSLAVLPNRTFEA